MSEPRVVGPEEMREWRSRLAPGATREVHVQLHHEGWDSAVSDDGLNATVTGDATPRRQFVEPSEIIDRNTFVMLSELHRLKSMSESVFMDRVTRIVDNLRAVNPDTFKGMSYQDVADQLSTLAAKVAASVAEPLYHKMGKLRPVDMDLTPVGHATGPILLPGQVGR